MDWIALAFGIMLLILITTHRDPSSLDLDGL
jgi:hypothetical protein